MAIDDKYTEHLLQAHIQCCNDGRVFTKVRGIKSLREEFGLGLVEAKSLVENSGYPFETDSAAVQMVRKLQR